MAFPTSAERSTWLPAQEKLADTQRTQGRWSVAVLACPPNQHNDIFNHMTFGAR
jgi:hypothetical protein